MKKRLYIGFGILSFLVMVATMAITVGMSFNTFEEQVVEDLRTDVDVLKTAKYILEYDENTKVPDIEDLRVTLINLDGEVVYDSSADTGSMENHKNRPEVSEAKETGVGTATRTSNTLGRNTYYYAEELDSGYIIRASKEVDSLWEFCLKILPVLIAELLVVFLVCIITAKILSKNLVKPIELLAQNLDSDIKVETYDEIQPFMDKIHSQHKDLKKSSLIRQEFTANVSHELKTPLASISGYAELIETGMAKESDIKHFAGEIGKSSKRLLSLINDIIELSQLDVMDHEMEKQLISLDEEAVSCVENLRVNAEKHDVILVTDIIENNCVIKANQQMIQEILYNLCDNAIRYNKPQGHVWVSVFNKGSKSVLQVRDDGIGISEEDLERIFERFYRVDKARSKQTGGTGLGLAIVKHIAEQHNAKIHIESELGKGTTISVTFNA